MARIVAIIIVVAVATPVAAQDYAIGAPGGYRFDPALGLPLAVPDFLREESYAPGERGLWFVQYPFVNRDRADALVAAEGFVKVVAYLAPAVLWIGTPEQAARVRSLPFVRYIGPWYPFEKGAYITRFDPWTRLSLSVTLANVDGVDAAVADIASYAEISGPDPQGVAGVNIQQQDLLRLMHNRYVVSFYPYNVNPLSQPWLVSVLPRSALPGDHVVISGMWFDACFSPRFPCWIKPPEVTFRGVPSPRVWVRDTYRIEAEVPAGLDAGPADIVVRLPGGSSQIFPGDVRGGFSIAPPGRRTFARDDALDAEIVPNCCFEGTYGRLRWRNGEGETRMLLDLAPTAVAFDRDGRLLVATTVGSAWYDTTLARMSAGPQEAADASTLLFDAQNNLVVVKWASVVRLGGDGRVLGRVEIGSSSADLAADQCTLYLAGTPVQRLDVCTMTLLSPLPGVSGVRLLPDGTLLATGDRLVRRQRLDGSVIAEFRTEAFVYGGGIAVSSDGAYVRIGKTVRYDLAANTLTIAAPDDDEDGAWTPSIAVYGGWTAARGFAHYADGEVDPTPPRRRSARW